MRQKIDWRAGLATDEHLAAIVQNPAITIEEIKNLPHSTNILLKEFAPVIYSEFQKILSDAKTSLNQENGEKNEAGEIPF